MEATVGKLGRELRRLKDALEAVRMTVIEDRPVGEAAVLVHRLEDALEGLVGWASEAVGAVRKVGEALGRERVRWRLVRQSLGMSQRSFHHAAQSYGLLVSYEGMAELVELGRERRGEWAAWVTAVQQGLEKCRAPVEAVTEAYLEGWEEITEG